MLGSEVVAAARAGGFSPVVFDQPEFDIRDEASLRAALAGADAVVNCAAYTQVDRAETEAELATAVNATAVGLLGRLAAPLGLYVIHVSTDFVFDGRLERPYDETDTAAPLNVYGRSKLAGEVAFRDSGCCGAIVRLEWTYGAVGTNFVRKIAERARTQSEVRVVSDQVGSPTWTRDAAGVLLTMVRERLCGLYHYAAQGYANRAEIAQFILRQLGLPCRVLPSRTQDFPAPAVRPLNSRFDCRRIDAALGLTRPTWQESLREFLGSLGPHLTS